MKPDAPSLHRAPSVGGLIKQINEMNPELGVQEIMTIIRRATTTRGELAGDYAAQEVVDEQQALALARATLPCSNPQK